MRKVDEKDSVTAGGVTVSSESVEQYTLLRSLAACTVLSLALAVTHRSLPSLLAQIYGASASAAYRPTLAVLVAAALLALRPTTERRSTGAACCEPGARLALAAVSLAVALRCGHAFVSRDARVWSRLLEALQDLLDACLGHGTAARGSGGLVAWTPVVASSAVEILFLGMLVVPLVAELRQVSAQSRVAPVMSICALLSLGWGTGALLQLCNLSGAGHLFLIALGLALSSVVLCRTSKQLSTCLAAAIVTVLLIRSTATLSAESLPWLLQRQTSLGDFRILASTASTTGQVTVLENDQYRLLKVDHSLLGGEWLGKGPGQSIFSTFYMQALAIYALDPPREDMRVLQIGLGIGTATKTVLYSPRFDAGRGSVSVDVVELDAAVVECAHRFFELPRPAHEPRLAVHVRDARDFVESAADGAYDFISHDVFTGGSLASDLFTVQFLGALKSKLTTGGLLTVNFVWSPKLGQASFEAVTNTLRSLFAEVVVYVENGKLEDVSNVLFLCSDVAPRLDIPDSGRTPVSTLGQVARNMKNWRFTGLSDIEYDERQILQRVELDAGRSLARTAHSDLVMALSHWRFMRELLPGKEAEIWTSF